MSESQKIGGESVVRYKKVVSVGLNTILNDEAQSVISVKVLCTRALLVDINKCCHCPFNKGLLNQHVMQCVCNPNEDELPEMLTDKKDIDYPEVENHVKQKG